MFDCIHDFEYMLIDYCGLFDESSCLVSLLYVSTIYVAHVFLLGLGSRVLCGAGKGKGKIDQP